MATSPILHRAQPKGGHRKYKKAGSQEVGGGLLLWGQPVSMSWECGSNKISVCLSELNCNLSVVLNPLDKNRGGKIKLT